MSQPDLFIDPPQPTWVRPKARSGCGRDPAAGPGSCWYWWELCPDAARRGCYFLWLKSKEEAT